MVFGAEEQIMKLNDEKPTNDLTEHKARGDSEVL